MRATGTLPPSDEATEQLLRRNAILRDAALEKVRLSYDMWTARQISLARLCADAGDALEAYATGISETLRGRTDSRDQIPLPQSAKDQSPETIGRVATAIRDQFADPYARHAVAQVLQTRVLRIEARLRHWGDAAR